MGDGKNYFKEAIVRLHIIKIEMFRRVDLPARVNGRLLLHSIRVAMKR